MNDLLRRMQAARQAEDPEALVALIPYARLLGVSFTATDEALTFRLDFHEGNVGNPYLPALHGGVIGAFMENAAILHLLWTQEATRVPKVVDFSIDYLRPGHPDVLWAACDVRRQGRRVANVGVAAWQEGDDGQRDVATARCHFLLADPAG
ncbi:PaaI family thioesterase [Arhodomonas sp. AD133]|uniref:PaaI family thioesterase n=1 Tax=Arhodomonas sp. AD133 TaxID=3415009 RepID=UPI003EB910DE